MIKKENILHPMQYEKKRILVGKTGGNVSAYILV
jgi:hypothetical protein